jgi:hypothetical protein
MNTIYGQYILIILQPRKQKEKTWPKTSIKFISVKICLFIFLFFSLFSPHSSFLTFFSFSLFFFLFSTKTLFVYTLAKYVILILSFVLLFLTSLHGCTELLASPFLFTFINLSRYYWYKCECLPIFFNRIFVLKLIMFGFSIKLSITH